MFVLEAKLYGSDSQLAVIDEMIRTAGFIRNKCLRHWMDNKGVGQYELSAYCKVLAKEFEWAKKLNSMARQASAERAWSAIKRFFDNCKKKVPGKKGFPKFQKSRSVEYKTSGYKLSEDRQSITFKDGFQAGTFRMRGAFDLNYYNPKQIKRIRVVRKADGYYAQFCIQHNKTENIEPSRKAIGLDVGLTHFYTDSDGNTVENPRFLRKTEREFKRLQKRVSRKKKGSKNRKKAIHRLGKKHLKVSRQRKDFVCKLARCVVTSNDVVVFENLRVRNMVSQRVGRVSRLEATGEPVRVKNHKLAKSISDVSWRQFFEWLEYYGKVLGKVVVPISPEYTSQECSACGEIVMKTLSQRTHICKCGCELDRDHNASLNILAKGLREISRGGQSQTASLELENAFGELSLYLPNENLVDKLSR
ncbi:MAG: transposase [Limnoraphis sp. WC205]|nr:transposase [Limnoraphis sp. WC205]